MRRITQNSIDGTDMKMLALVVMLGFFVVATADAASATNLYVDDLHVPSESPRKLQIGPAVSVLSMPRLMAAGVEAKYDRLWGLGLDWGYTPGSILGHSEATITQPQLNLSVYPWRENFYAGVGLGYMNAHIEKNESGKQIEADARMLMLIPRIGWRWVFNSGFFLATEVGASICLTSSIESSSSDADLQEMLGSRWVRSKMDNANQQMRGRVSPYFTLIQMGWYL